MFVIVSVVYSSLLYILLGCLVLMLCGVYNLYCLRLFLLVHYIGYIAPMSDLLGIIDILDDDGDLHLDELSAASVSAAVDVASHVAQPNWITFSGLFFDLCVYLYFVLFLI